MFATRVDTRPIGLILRCWFLLFSCCELFCVLQLQLSLTLEPFARCHRLKRCRHIFSRKWLQWAGSRIRPHQPVLFQVRLRGGWLSLDSRTREWRRFSCRRCVFLRASSSDTDGPSPCEIASVVHVTSCVNGRERCHVGVVTIPAAAQLLSVRAPDQLSRTLGKVLVPVRTCKNLFQLVFSTTKFWMCVCNRVRTKRRSG